MQTVFLLVGWLISSFLGPLPKEHPFHVGVVEVNHNKVERTLEIQCKMYTDDFETTLSRLFKQKVDLIDPKFHDAMDSLVEKYLSGRVRLGINGKGYKGNYLGFEHDKEAVYAFIEIPAVPNEIREVQFDISLLFDLYDDQINLVHFTTNGQRKSTKLDYPQSKGTLTF